jgi:hypothetical protein
MAKSLIEKIPLFGDSLRDLSELLPAGECFGLPEERVSLLCLAMT